MKFLKQLFLCSLMSICFIGSSFAVGQQQNQSGQEQAQPTQEEVKHECGICLNTDGQGEPIRAAGCCHLFHDHCLRRWLQVKEECPVCRRQLNPETFEIVTEDQIRQQRRNRRRNRRGPAGRRRTTTTRRNAHSIVPTVVGAAIVVAAAGVFAAVVKKVFSRSS